MRTAGIWVDRWSGRSGSSCWVLPNDSLLSWRYQQVRHELALGPVVTEVLRPVLCFRTGGDECEEGPRSSLHHFCKCFFLPHPQLRQTSLKNHSTVELTAGPKSSTRRNTCSPRKSPTVINSSIVEPTSAKTQRLGGREESGRRKTK